MRFEVDIPPGRPQIAEVGNGRLRAGQNNEIDAGGNGRARTDELEVNGWLHAQRIEVIEVGDAWIGEHGDAHRGAGLCLARGKAQRVLGR